MEKQIELSSHEEIFYEFTPNQKINFGFYIVCFIFLIAFGLGLIFAIYEYYSTKCKKWIFTNERIIFKYGVFSKHIEQVELYRVKDISVNEPFFYRLLGLANIEIRTSDRTSKIIYIKGIDVNEVNKLAEKLRNFTEKRRDEKGVKEIDFR